MNSGFTIKSTRALSVSEFWLPASLVEQALHYVIVGFALAAPFLEHTHGFLAEPNAR